MLACRWGLIVLVAVVCTTTATSVAAAEEKKRNVGGYSLAERKPPAPSSSSQFEEEGEKMKIEAQKKDTLAALTALLPDDDVWQSLWVPRPPTTADAKKDSSPAPEYPFDPCLTVKEVRCNNHSEIISLTLRDAVGRIDFSAIPTSVETMEIFNAKLSQPLKLSSIPLLLSSFTCHHAAVSKEQKVLGDEGENAKEGRKSLRPRLRFLELNDCAIDGTTFARFVTLEALRLIASPNLSPRPSIPVAELPSSVREVHFQGFSAHSVDLSAYQRLPLTKLSLVDCEIVTITGTPPASLSEVTLAANDLSSLPEAILDLPALKVLNVSRNRLQKIPSGLNTISSLHVLDISYNTPLAQSYRFDASGLPPRLVTFAAAHIGLEGTLSLSHTPRTIEHLDVENNRLTGTLDFNDLPPMISYFSVKSNAFSGPLNMKVLPASSKFFFLQNNKFTGRPDVSRLPIDLRRILFGNNSWTRILPPL